MNFVVYSTTFGILSIGLTVFCPSCLYIQIFATVLAAISILGVFTALWINIKLGSPHKTTLTAEVTIKQVEIFRNKLIKDYETNLITKPVQQNNLPPIFGRAVDSLLQQMLDFVVRDYILVYLNDYAYESDSLASSIKEDLWGAIQILHEKLTRVDCAKLIACDIVVKITQHFEKIREAKTFVVENDRPPIFELSPHVISSEKELDYLRNISELLIMFLLPRSYSLSPTKYFLREILSCKVFKPIIDTLTDPDFFNRNVIHYIQTNQKLNSIHTRAFEYTHSFDDLMKLIDRTNDIESLKQIRYSIVTRLMQATTLQNLNRAKGLDLDNEKSILTSSGVQKSDINAAKKLRKFINQLTFAKKECDKKLGYQFSDDVRKVLSLPTILDHVLGRKYLSQFLQTLASQDLVRFWTAVEELRNAQRKNWHQLGAEIFYAFIRNSTSEIKVDKAKRKRMEAFLLGDKGPEVFYEVQHQVVQILEDKYYQPFLISDYYKEMINAIEKAEDCLDAGSLRKSLEERQTSTDSVGSLENGLNVGDHSNYARRKLDQLQEKVQNKSQALSALRQSLRSGSKILLKLEQEVEWLEGEQRQLEAHLNRTEVWGENLGKWCATVQSAEVTDEKEPPQFVLVVHMMENDEELVEGEECISTGWVVCRSLNQFQELHKKLRPLCSEIRNLDLPSSTFKFLFGKNDKVSLEKAKQQIQKYLDFVLKDDRLNQSEAIYSFLSPSSEHLKHSTPSPKKSRFSFSTLFKSNEQNKDSFSILRESEDEDLDAPPSNSDSVDFTKPTNGHTSKYSEDNKDTIAEPLYGLLSELFDMRGVFKYVRKTLIGFVQVTYGRTINRQIYETISWWFSEQMLHYYVTLLLKNFWPGGTLAEARPQRSHEEMLKTAKLAQELLINNVPELLNTLVGANAAKSGTKKLFDALQEKNMNKHLFYEIFEVAMDVVFPELS